MSNGEIAASIHLHRSPFESISHGSPSVTETQRAERLDSCIGYTRGPVNMNTRIFRYSTIRMATGFETKSNGLFRT
jgi:hypothetical protein